MNNGQQVDIMQMRTSSRLPIRAALKRYDNMKQRTEDDFCGCGGTQTDNVHQMQEHLLMCLTVMRQRQSAAFEDQSLQATDRACRITLMWDTVIMSPRTNLAATNRNWSFGKTWVTGRWVGAGTVEVAAGHTNAATETITSFTPVSVWLQRVQSEF